MISFLDKHFGSILTAIITVIVSIAAIYVSCKQVEVAEIESDRQWRIEAANFIMQNNKSIFGKDNKIRERYFEIIELVFPPEISFELRQQMFDQYTIDTKNVLLTFLKPNGEKVHKLNSAEFTEWLRIHEPNMFNSFNSLADSDLIKTVIVNTNFVNIRKQAAKDLNLKHRVQVYGDVHEDVVSKKEKELVRKGAEVFVNIQNNGKYQITVIYPH